MATLVDREIKDLLEVPLEEGGVGIEPLRDPHTQIQPASVDLLLGGDFAGISNGIKELQRTQALLGGSMSPAEMQKELQKRMTIDPREKPSDSLYMKIQVDEGDFIILPPMTFLLGTTLEKVSLPDNIVGRVEGKSSFGRLGVSVHVTAGFIDPGFSGQVTLEIFNHSSRPIKLYVGDPICQLVLEKTRVKAARPYGHPELRSKYQNQTGATVCKFHEEGRGENDVK